MGKNKGQRTKNNARPSNSSRSAELLHKDGGCVTLLPGLSLTNNAELSHIEPTFQVVLKKMNKKDAATKCKALLEFAELCSNSESTTVETILPFWRRLYYVLSIDVDNRVREAVQLAHATFVKQVGKAIAPYLKQLAGPWFVSQYDMYPPAASAATNCFNTTFPDEKFVRAIVHCQDEILSYICDNLTVHTPQTLTTNKSLTPEEMEAKYQRVVTSSLQAYSFYLKSVSSADIEKTAEYHKTLIHSSKFWKLSKHEVPSIKTAFFGALTALICHANSIVCEEKRKALTTIMNSLDETEPALLTAIWESLLVAINKIEDWHKVLSIEKLVLPKLWRVLKNGGQYCASVVHPNLLPFLSQLTKLELNKTTLFTNFFENMRQGFSAKSVKLSRSETFAVVTSFVECFRYAILVNCSNEDICKTLLKDQLMPVIELCMYENQSMRATLFCELSHLIRYWSKNSTNPDYPAYAKLMKTFWFELIAIFNRLVDNSSDNYDTTTSSIVNSMAELLIYLKNAPDHNRRNMTVKFFDSAKPVEAPATPSTPTQAPDDSDNVAFLKELQQFVTKLSVSYFKRIMDKPFKHKVIKLVKIITGHESKELFMALAKAYDESASLLQFYNKNLRILMITESEETEALINLIFSIMSHMSSSEKEVVLNSFVEVDDVKILKTAVQCALTKRYREDSTVRNWCRRCVITNTLSLTAQNVLSSFEFTEFDEKMFTLAFEPALDGDLIVCNEAIRGISSLLCLVVDRMPWDNERQNQKVALLLSRLLALSWSHKDINYGATELLKALFRFHVRDIVERGEDDNESTAANVAQEAWTKGLYELAKKTDQTAFSVHVKYFSTIIWQKIFLTKEVLNEAILNLTTIFVDAVIMSGEVLTRNDKPIENSINEFPAFEEPYTIALIPHHGSKMRKWMKEASGIIFYGQVVTGNLYASKLIQRSQTFNEVFDINLCNANFEDNTHNCLKWAAASTKVLSSLTSNISELPEISELLINVLYAATLGEIYIKHYNTTKYSNDVNTILKVLHEELNSLKTLLSDDIHNNIISRLNQLIVLLGGIYPHILKFYYNFFTPSNNLSDLFENLTSLPNDKLECMDVLLQTFQKLDNFARLQHALPCLIDDSDFYKIFSVRNQSDQSKMIISMDEIFNRLKVRLHAEPSSLLLNCNVGNVPWEEFILPLEAMSFFTKCIKLIPKHLSTFQWDIIRICLSHWTDSIKKSIDHHEEFKVRALVISVNKLYYAVQKFMKDQAKQPDEKISPALLDEWEKLFASSLQVAVFEAWMVFAEFYNKNDLSIVSTLPLNYLGKSLSVFDGPIISSDTSKNTELRESENRIMKLLLELIHSPVLSLQLSTYIALNNIIDVLVERDKAIIEEEDFDLKALNINKFEQVLITAQTIVNALLMDFKLCDAVSCTIQPYTDSYTYTIGYLFTWGVVLNMCAKANGDLRYHYAEILKNDFFPSLLNNIFRLMPIEVLQDTKNKSAKLVEIFSTQPSFDFNDSWTEWRLDHLVCWLYTNCLRYLPVLVRQWWSTADSRVSTAVDKITTSYVSPLLCNEELNDNRINLNKLTNVENMQIKVRPSVREVVALYQMDDTKLELNIILPPNHPLGAVTVKPGNQAGGTANWRNCHMQLSIFLTHQNGSIWDGLMLWKANLDKRFAGVEECYICFSIFHVSTYQIPKLSCHICRKKFHKPCLYKWFSTSQKATCPICRNEF